MRIQLDTAQKIIKLEENVKLSELVEILEGLLPKGEWKNFTLETNTVIQHWNSPVVIERYVQSPYYGPWWGRVSGSISSLNSTSKLSPQSQPRYKGQLKAGVYNVELK